MGESGHPLCTSPCRPHGATAAASSTAPFALRPRPSHHVPSPFLSNNIFLLASSSLPSSSPLSPLPDPTSECKNISRKQFIIKWGSEANSWQVVALGRKPIHLKDGREVKPEDGPVSIASRETLRIDCKYPECKCHFMHFVAAKNPDDLIHMVPSTWGAKDYEQLRRNLVMYGYNRWDVIKKDGLNNKADSDIVNHADSTLLVWRSQLGQDERRFIDFLVGDKQAAKAITIDCKHLVMKDLTKFQVTLSPSLPLSLFLPPSLSVQTLCLPSI